MKSKFLVWASVLICLVLGFTLARNAYLSAAGFDRGTTLSSISPVSNERWMERIDPNLIHRWNDAYINAIRANNTPPCLGARALAMAHLALDRCLNRVQPRFEPIAVELPAPAVETEPWSEDDTLLALNACALAMGEALFTANRPAFESLFRAETGLLPKNDRALALGREVASEILRWRENDGATTTVHYVPRSEPGMWRRTAPRFRPPETPQKATVRPFLLESPSQFRPPPPPAHDSPAFAEARDEVKALGAKESVVRTEEQSLIARFWSDFSYTSTPPGHWNELAIEKMAERKVSGHDAARLLALLNLAMADAAIAAWDCKYEYNFWRPETAIQHAGEKDWVSYLPCPPHPEFVSGHAAISGAAAGVLEAVLPLRRGETLLCRSDTVKDAIRHLPGYRACAEEIAASRVYGGIHYRFSGEAGLKLGSRVAEVVIRTTGR